MPFDAGSGKIDPAGKPRRVRWETSDRFYEAEIRMDLFGDEVLEITWGGKQHRIGQRRCIDASGCWDAVLQRIHKERQRRHYQLLES